ncbi:MAG: hypothetical protein WBA74_10675 [Cyclobacteriaceae bacterium]
MTLRLIFISAFLFLYGLVSAQQVVRPEIDLEDFAERLFQIQDDDVIYEDLYESLLLFYSNPINLNNTTREELASLFVLSPSQLAAFFNHIEKTGKLLSIYELQSIDGFDRTTIESILPFVTLIENQNDNLSLFKKILNEENKYLILRHFNVLEEQRGYRDDNDNRYLGSQNRLYGRFKSSHSRDFSFGFTFEKDPGEPLSFGKAEQTNGFDFYSFHLQVYNRGRIKALAIGDYQLQFGQGLVFGAGFNPGKGSETVATIKRSSLGVRPYSSVLESGFFRGGAITLKQNKFEFTTFYSRLRQDGNPQNDITFTDFDEFVSSIQATGFHRTRNELANKNRILEQNVGGNITFKDKSLEIGTNILYTDYSLPLFRRPNNYNQFEFRGDKNYLGSVYANYVWQNFILFSEVARSKSGGVGAIGGFATSLTRAIDFSMVLRNYDRNFHSLYGNAFGESTRNINEQGIYWGIKVKPSRKYFLTAYYDKFTFPWLRFRTEAPSEGYEYLIRANYAPKRNVLIYAQWRQEFDQITTNESGGNLNRLTDTRKNNYIVNLDYRVNTTISLRSRVQWSDYLENDVSTSGFVVLQDINLRFRKFRFSGRIALFDTDDFENRQYVYERNVLYAFSIPAYNGVGVRNYLLVQYNPTRKINIWARYARFKFRDRDIVGTGNEQSEGNTRSDLILQVRMKF